MRVTVAVAKIPNCFLTLAVIMRDLEAASPLFSSWQRGGRLQSNERDKNHLSNPVICGGLQEGVAKVQSTFAFLSGGLGGGNECQGCDSMSEALGLQQHPLVDVDKLLEDGLHKLLGASSGGMKSNGPWRWVSRMEAQAMHFERLGIVEGGIQPDQGNE